MNNPSQKSMNLQTATFAGGCFWCTEAIFKRLKGVMSVTPGYSGGTKENPHYDEVSSGSTGHAEAVQIEFDPHIITYERLLDIFWHAHNPTTLNQQGNDMGTQYRSMILYHSDEQRKLAENSKEELENQVNTKTPLLQKFNHFSIFIQLRSITKTIMIKIKMHHIVCLLLTQKLKSFSRNMATM